MEYRQITSEERYMIAALKQQGFHQSQIATALGRHRSSISREIRRNRSKWDMEAIDLFRLLREHEAEGRVHAGIANSQLVTFGSWQNISKNCGAQNRSLAGCAKTGRSLSAMKPSIVTSGGIRPTVGIFTSTLGVPARYAGNAITAMTAEAGSQENVTFRKGRNPSKGGPGWAIGK